MSPDYRLGLSPLEGEFELDELPRINYDSRTGCNYSYVYGIGQDKEEPNHWPNRLVKVDVREGSSRAWREEPCYPGEPVFIPTPDAQEEDAGVVLSVVLDDAAETSFLLVLDAASFTEVARARVPHHVPFDFHGQFFSWSALQFLSISARGGREKRPRVRHICGERLTRRVAALARPGRGERGGS